MKLTGENGITRGKTSPSASLSTTNPTWTYPGLGGGRPATSSLSHGTALSLCVTYLKTLRISMFKSDCDEQMARRFGEMILTGHRKKDSEKILSLCQFIQHETYSEPITPFLILLL
jgi:hypothetical protein